MSSKFCYTNNCEIKILFEIFNIIVDDHHWQPWYILKDQVLPFPFIDTRLTNIIKEIRHFYSFFEIQWLFEIIFWLLFIFPAIFMVIINDNDKKIERQFVSSTTGLLLIMVVGREIAIDAADKLSTNYRRIHLFLTWLLINIGILIVYYYIYSFMLFSTFNYHYRFLLSPDLIEYGWFFKLIFIVSLCQSKTPTTNTTATTVS
jgi:hypothetical protein